jgi:hypothetical protein
MTLAHEDSHGHHGSQKDEYENGGAVAFAVVYSCIALAVIAGILIFG